MKAKDSILYAEDSHESVRTLLKLRAPSLGIGLILGIGISFLTSSFEEVLTQNVQVAFFMPFIVYIADAIGTQTEAIYTRGLKTGKVNFFGYFRKELTLGLIFGLAFGCFSGAVVLLWLKSQALALSVSLATFLAILFAPIIALTVTQISQSLREDPAANSGPILTVIQDMMSILIYGTVCTTIFL